MSSRHPRLHALQQGVHNSLVPLDPIVFDWGDLPLPERD